MEAGHTFLATLGKKRLRPGGKKGTKFLFKNANIDSNTYVLEVACNIATSAIELVKKYDLKKIVICDLDDKALEKALENVKKAGFEDRFTIVKADATNLPFENETFDVVINEAMLTMLLSDKKEKAVSEYYRVLKNNGRLLTHDVLMFAENIDIQKKIKAELSRAINVHVDPLTNSAWRELFLNAGFKKVTNDFGKMTLMNPVGMIRDEGLLGAVKIINKGLKKLGCVDNS
ncbi:class I SAM-dependent methyltransferase [Haploplasma axanthum]|nr:class I SAM-dependent methyltransferase [Haploplasma axanthum]